MDGSLSSQRRTSFDRRSQSRRLESGGVGAQFTLSRTRSQEMGLVESVAIQETDPVEFKSDIGEDDACEEVNSLPYSTRYSILLCAFLTSTSFGVTQVPLLYVIRLMTCDEYYQTHDHEAFNSTSYSATGSWTEWISSRLAGSLIQLLSFSSNENGDRCSVRQIESHTALHISLLGASTTIFGIINLFITGILIKRIGLKMSLILNVGTPALRLLVQNIGVEVWGNLGIVIIQCSQIMNILGGPSGYLLVLNSFMTEAVEYEERTAALGRLTGAMMFGSASGFLVGGLLAEDIGITVPFRVTLALFVASAIYVTVFLPYVVPPDSNATDDKAAIKHDVGRLRRFFQPLLVFTPKRFVTREGNVQREYGIFLLAWGVLLGILATGYLQTLLQLYATDIFGFGTKANGWLIFVYSSLRGVFLTFAFPNVISLGRRLTSQHVVQPESSSAVTDGEHDEHSPLLPATNSSNLVHPKQKTHKAETYAFDLMYTRASLLADGVLTLLCTFIRQGWQMYLVAAILPFSAGTGSAAKGTVLQMIGSSASSAERVDALAGLSLVENIARLSTTFVFGVIFAAFASIGRHDLVFTCNAGVAVFGFIMLLFARFPPESSRRIDHVDSDDVSDNRATTDLNSTAR